MFQRCSCTANHGPFPAGAGGWRGGSVSHPRLQRTRSFAPQRVEVYHMRSPFYDRFASSSWPRRNDVLYTLKLGRSGHCCPCGRSAAQGRHQNQRRVEKMNKTLLVLLLLFVSCAAMRPDVRDIRSGLLKQELVTSAF